MNIGKDRERGWEGERVKVGELYIDRRVEGLR
jgi:hypothetical protein